MFENTAIRVIVGLVILFLGFLLLKYFSADKEDSITEYAAPVNRKKPTILKNSKGIFKKLQQSPPQPKTVSWAPSPVDAHISEYGEWDTNRNPPNFVTNVAKGFPENDEGASNAPLSKWSMTPAQKMITPTIPDVGMTDEYSSLGMQLPDVGYDNVFDGEFGASLDN
ncbi:hypothetical protein PBCVAN69C_189R [Paramecium bursaria Chlorella virus AN69C]|uniref:Uncharacterized protein n=2 Tax=Chlorovirus TaxID=181083 RepID=Q84488_PBCV1|nr:hypothetical protein PBCV1_A168R [Paramecium bursaria Chlorella virus 1]AGE48390.1 hypothetical protein PBCVAN69C_189R [Paramecium bursaria Chlorella virus AN69C]AGE53804.1 hypothetical protein PBCVIL3A_185R [Paramecium bursaria Chlorella virus IL3A]AGE54498.1 hypothetical protein PBCVKS1B_118R [Paramecium bursaria Chlorella virus KS1B]AGE57234.1 hypothetical protein PBCVNEJV4_195R [Paramecium bursaria Chlorella virus NE-JV-4]AAC96536.1 hypothetical protein [Paramecium bursaria Chlorella vi